MLNLHSSAAEKIKTLPSELSYQVHVHDSVTKKKIKHFNSKFLQIIEYTCIIYGGFGHKSDTKGMIEILFVRGCKGEHLKD